MKIVWTIAGSDSSGAAGLQADLRAFAAFGAHGACVITAITAQSLDRFAAASPVSTDLVVAQLDALASMPRPSAVKLGMLASVGNVEAVARVLADMQVFVVLDPVLRSTSGGALSDPDVAAAVRTTLLPHVDLVTPNVPEAAHVTGVKIETTEDMEKAAAALLAMGAKRVLLKGGHLPRHPEGALATEGSHLVHDYYTDGTRSYWLTSPAHRLAVRGTGCALASAIAANVANGHELDDALVIARAHVARGIRLGAAPDALPGILQTQGPAVADDFPWVTRSIAAAVERPEFPTCGPEPLGFYPVVDSAAWVRRLVELGTTTIQLRVKSLTGDALRREIQDAVQVCREKGVRLFVNDHWQLAVEHGAYGVHLGQEDLETADVHAIARAGLRLGVSTHAHYELAVARALRPSYVALGPIFETTCKSMRFGPQGFARIAEWSALAAAPLVAIGGLKAEHVREARARGADGVAVISDVTRAADPDAQARRWLAACAERTTP